MVGIWFSEDHYKSGYERRPIDVSYVAAILKMPLCIYFLYWHHTNGILSLIRTL